MSYKQIYRPLFWMLCVSLSLWCTSAAYAEIIDRIVAVVDGHLITLSDIRKERQIRAVLGEKPIDDDRALVDQLIDTQLIELQIGNSPSIDITDAQVNEELQQLSPPSGIDLNALRDAVRQRIRIQEFFDTRFRQLIRPTDEEIRQYYEEVFVPEARKRGLQTIPPVTDTAMADAVRENVIQERLDRDVEAWIETIRRRSNIEIF